MELDKICKIIYAQSKTDVETFGGQPNSRNTMKRVIATKRERKKK